MKLGFIGCGNMAQAMITGIIGQNVVPAEEIIAADPASDKIEEVKEKLQINITTDNCEAAKADIVVLSVKPQMYKDVIHEIRDYITKSQLVVTIAAGVAMAQSVRQFGKEVKIVRVMPNTPALVGEGMAGICRNEYTTSEDMEKVCRIFRSFGKVEIVTESLMDAVVGVSGSSPAYVYMFIEALADAAVMQGIPRDKAYTFAAQSVYGSAKMVLETGKHPGELKDAVCSPAGTTIEAVRVLEEKGMRSAVIEATIAASEKSKEMGK